MILQEKTAASAAGGDASPARKIYAVGTLRYTLGGVVVLFLWLLWGDFCFTIFESIFGKFLPLYLKDLDASNRMIGIMTGSLGGIVNVLFLPNISMASDRHRGRRGRRIPFLFWSTPCAVGAMVMIGFSSEIGAWLHRALSVLPGGVSLSVVTLGVLFVLVLGYHFFNMVLVNIYNCLLRDVVPAELMARFLALFRVVGTAGTFVFSWYLFPHVLEHRQAVCAGIGGTYLAAFMLMCWRVKEGEYPPPPATEKRTGFFKSFLAYFREALAVPIYRNYLLMYAAVTTASTSAGAFVTLFARNSLHLTMDDIGKVLAWSALGSALTYLPMGYLCDKIAPMRVALISLVGLAVAWGLGFFVAQDRTTWLVYSVIVAMLPSVGWNLGFNALTMQLFPTEKFGQLSSSLNVFGYGSVIAGNYLAGWFIDVVASDYRMIFVWSLSWFALAIIPMALVYRDWKRYGGPRHYVAPLPA
jgi:MFS family permease